MRICIVGAGAIGGLPRRAPGARGADVTLVARGPHLAALRRDGLTLVERDGSRSVHRIAVGGAHRRGRASRTWSSSPLKATQLEAASRPSFPRSSTRDTVVVPMQNGIPWWYFQRHGGAHEGRRVAAVDPARHDRRRHRRRAHRGLRRLSRRARSLRPGVMRHVEGERFPLGELDGTRHAARAGARRSSSTRARPQGARCSTDIRSEIWLKLWGNLTFNPISALTRATLDRICGEPLTRALAAAMMTEAAGGRGEARHHLPRLARAAHRGRGARRQPQDLDAPGHRGGPRHGDRRPAGLGDRARAPHRHRRSPPRGGLCLRAAARAHRPPRKPFP